MAINIAVFVWVLIGDTSTAGFGSSVSSREVDLGLNKDLLAYTHEWYRLITSGFLHFGILHIAMNMYLLFQLGKLLEAPLGRVRFGLLYFACLLGGSLGVLVIEGSSNGLHGGASGAVFGLMGAIDRFDPDQGVKFESYAVPRIRGAILDGLRALDWVPRSVRSRARTVQDAITALEHRLGREPTDEEIAAEAGIGTEELAVWLADIAAGSVGPLDHVAMESARSSDDDVQPGVVIEETELRSAMRAEIGRLPERERAVLVLYYDDGLTLAEIGEALGVTESRISQIHAKAVLQLRSRLASAGMA
jgi:RNA polymerase sigma factor for flagellar operon FliA